MSKKMTTACKTREKTNAVRPPIVDMSDISFFREEKIKTILDALEEGDRVNLSEMSSAERRKALFGDLLPPAR